MFREVLFFIATMQCLTQCYSLEFPKYIKIWKSFKTLLSWIWMFWPLAILRTHQSRTENAWKTCVKIKSLSVPLVVWESTKVWGVLEPNKYNSVTQTNLPLIILSSLGDSRDMWKSAMVTVLRYFTLPKYKYLENDKIPHREMTRLVLRLPRRSGSPGTLWIMI